MKAKQVLCLLPCVLAAVASAAAPKFQAALPVWPEGRATRMNDFVEFRASFEA